MRELSNNKRPKDILKKIKLHQVQVIYKSSNNT